MPSESLKPTAGGGWPLDGTDPQDQQLSNYYNAAANQYGQSYNLYAPSFYRYPYLPPNTGAFYGTNGFEYNGYPAAAAYNVQYYNRSMGGVGTSPISSASFQQYTNNLVSNGAAFGSSMGATTNGGLKSASPSPSANYYNDCTTPKIETKPKKSKRRKPANVHGKQEVVYKRVYVWELDELAADSPLFSLEPEVRALIGQILSRCFELTSTEDFDHTNIEDANIDESLAEQQLAAYQSEAFGAAAEAAEDVKPVGLGGLDALGLSGNSSASAAGGSTAAMSASALDNIKRIAACQQHIKRVYLEHQIDVVSLLKRYGLDHEFPNVAHVLENRRQYAAHKPQPYGRCLKTVVERSTPDALQANVVLCQEPLPLAFAKLLVQGVSPNVQPENVYSAARNDAANALERIVARFKREKLVVISGRLETVDAAKALNIPVWRVLQQPKDVETFYIALDQHLS